MWHPATFITLLIIHYSGTSDIKALDNRKSLFTKEGSVTLTNSYAHLVLPYRLNNLKDLIRQLNLIRAQFGAINIPNNEPPGASEKRTNTERQRERARRRLKFIGTYINQTVLDVTTRCNDVLKLVNSETLSTDPLDYTRDIRNYKPRPKRQLIAGGIGLLSGLVGGVVSSLFSATTMNDILQNKQTVLSHAVEDNIIQLNRNHEDVRTLNDTIIKLQGSLIKLWYDQDDFQLESALITAFSSVSIIGGRVRDIANSLSAARAGKLALEHIDAAALHRHLQELQGKAAQTGHRLTATDIMDLTVCKTSYFMTNQTVFTIIHIPIYLYANSLTLYRHIPTPIQIENNLPDQPIVYLMITPPLPYLAVNSQRTLFIEIDTPDLALCTHKEDTFFCPHLSYLKDNAPSCVYSLFLQSHPKVSRNCDGHYTTKNYAITRVSINTWLHSTTSPELVHIECTHQNSSEKELQGSHLIRLDKGCTASSTSMTITRPPYEADIQNNLEFVQNHFESPGVFYNISPQTIVDLVKATHHVSSDDIKRYTQLKHDLASVTAGSYSISNFIHRALNIFSTSCVSLILIVGVIAASFYLLRHIRNRPHSKTATYHRAAPPDEEVELNPTAHQANTGTQPKRFAYTQHSRIPGDFSMTEIPTMPSMPALPGLPSVPVLPTIPPVLPTIPPTASQPSQRLPPYDVPTASLPFTKNNK